MYEVNDTIILTAISIRIKPIRRYIYLSLGYWLFVRCRLFYITNSFPFPENDVTEDRTQISNQVAPLIAKQFFLSVVDEN